MIVCTAIHGLTPRHQRFQCARNPKTCIVVIVVPMVFLLPILWISRCISIDHSILESITHSLASLTSCIQRIFSLSTKLCIRVMRHKIYRIRQQAGHSTTYSLIRTTSEYPILPHSTVEARSRYLLLRKELRPQGRRYDANRY